ncbi:uncharacterized [Tachysurus ichikawai]
MSGNVIRRIARGLREHSDRLMEDPSYPSLPLCPAICRGASKRTRPPVIFQTARRDSTLTAEVRGEERDAPLQLSSLDQMTDGGRYGRENEKEGEGEICGYGGDTGGEEILVQCIMSVKEIWLRLQTRTWNT